MTIPAAQMGALVKYLMIFSALLSFGFAFWVARLVKLDIQMILMVGFAAVLHELSER